MTTSPITPETTNEPELTNEVSFYSAAMLICPHCGTALDRKKVKAGGYLMVHGLVTNCPLTGKKFIGPTVSLKELTL